MLDRLLPNRRLDISTERCKVTITNIGGVLTRYDSDICGRFAGMRLEGCLEVCLEASPVFAVGNRQLCLATWLVLMRGFSCRMITWTITP